MVREKAEYTKLTDGSWGIKIRSDLKAGQTVVVQKKDGTTKYVTVTERVTEGQYDTWRIQE